MPTITLTLGQIYTAAKIAGSLSQPLPAKASYAIGRLSNTLQPLLLNIDKERLALCDKYGKRAEDGTPVTDAAGNFVLADTVAFNAAWDELLADTDEVQVHQVPLAVLTNAGVSIPPSTMAALDFMFTDDQGATP